MMNWDTLLNPERSRSTTRKVDHREQFERDYDRSVFSSPVKRLQDKAQVFPLDPHDSVRTRLTHSLEVSSVARGLVHKVCKNFLLPAGHIKVGQDRQIEAIAATCGLIHDLGNPPFGHSVRTRSKSGSGRTSPRTVCASCSAAGRSWFRTSSCSRATHRPSVLSPNFKSLQTSRG